MADLATQAPPFRVTTGAPHVVNSSPCPTAPHQASFFRSREFFSRKSSRAPPHRPQRRRRPRQPRSGRLRSRDPGSVRQAKSPTSASTSATRPTTFAEYQGLIAALEYTLQHGPKALKLISDSELLVRQIKGIYKVKNATLKDLHGRAKELIAQLEWFSIGHALREHNTEADRLANEAMDKGMGRSGSEACGPRAACLTSLRNSRRPARN